MVVRRRRVAMWLGAAVVGVWAVVVALMLVAAAKHVRVGQGAARSAQSSLTASEVSDSNAPDRLEPVRREFAAAHALLVNPVIVPLRFVPVAGRQLRAVTSLAGAITKVAVIGQSAVGTSRTALQAPHRTGAQRLAAIRMLTATAAKTNNELAHVDPGSGTALVGPVARAHDEFVRRVAKLREGLGRGVAGGTSLTTLLAGPRHSLVLMANNAEMRVGSGMFLSAATLDTVDGALRLGDVYATPDLILAGDGVEPFAGDMADRWGWLHPNREWRNLGLSPRFDTTAPLAARMWQSVKGEPLDGVIALDIEALKALLTGTGPIDVDGQQVSADNVEPLLLHDQYVGVAIDDASQAARKERLGRIAHAVLRALQDGDFNIGRLSSSLAGEASGRHFMFWSKDATEQRDWQLAGVAGTLSANDLLVGLANRGGNKLDQFLAVSSELSLRTGAAITDVTVTVHLMNHTPPGQPDYIVGTFPGSGVQPGDYLGLVAISVPGNSTGVTVEGSPKVNAYGRDGPTLVVAVQKAVKPDTAATVVVHFRLPGAHGAMRVLGSARLPGVDWTLAGGPTRWVDDHPRTIAW